MDVDDAVAPPLDEARREQPHEAGEADQLDPGAGAAPRRSRCRTLRARRSRGDRRPWSRCRRRAARSRPCASALFETTSTISAGKFRLSAQASISACRLLPRPEMRTPTFSRAMTCPSRRSRPRARSAARAATRADATRRFRRGPRAAARASSASAGRDDRDHADAAVEGARHLGRADRRRPRRASGTPAARSRRRRRDATPSPSGSDARDVVDEPAAGDVRERLDAARADRGEAGLDVDARRRQQRVAQALARRERRGRAVVEAGAGDDMAHQRIAVGMHARRGQAEHHVAGRDRLRRSGARRARRRRRRSPPGRSRRRHRARASRPSRRRSARSRPRGSRARCP